MDHKRQFIIFAATLLLIGSCSRSPVSDKLSSAQAPDVPMAKSGENKNQSPLPSNDDTIVSILKSWSENNQSQLVRQFVDLVQADPPQNLLLLSPLTEDDFKKATPARRDKMSAALLDLTQRYKLLSRATLDAGTAALEAGDEPLAHHCFDAVERCAQINQKPPVTKLIDIVAQSIENAARKAKESLPD